MDNTTWKHLPVRGVEYDSEHDTLMRQSTSNQIGLCGYRTKLRDEVGYLAAVSEPMVFGSCMHYMISQDLEDTEDPLNLIACMDEWVELILVYDYNWSLSEIPNVRDFFSELSSAYTQWKAVVRPVLPLVVSAIEQEMFLPLGEGERGTIFLKGTPDIVYKDEIIDWKTAGRGWKESKAHHLIQVDAYMALVKQNLGRSIRSFIFWIYDRRHRSWDRIETSRRIRDIDAALLRLLDEGKALESNAFHATPTTDTFGEVKRGWYCSAKYCGAWNICPAKFLNDNVDEKEIAVRSW